MFLQETTAPAGTQTTSAAGITMVVAQVGAVVFVIAVIALLAYQMIRTGLGPTTLRQGERSWLDYGSFYVVALGIAGVIIGFLVILLFADRFSDLTQALGFLTALFGAITGLVGTYFGVKSSTDAREGAERLQTAAAAGPSPPPLVSSINPPAGAQVDGNTAVTATFSTAMDPSTINRDTFRLESLGATGTIQVPGETNYDPQSFMATYIPSEGHLAAGTYLATITLDVKDQTGKTLPQPYIWQFTVRRPAKERPAEERPAEE